MSALQISEITDADIDEIVSLWERCSLTRPWNDPRSDISFARSNGNATVLVGRFDGRIVASAMVGHDGHRGAVYYVSVDPDHQGNGYGRAIMEAAESWLANQGVWKLNLMVRAENKSIAEFYKALGYETEQRINFGKRLEPTGKPDANC